MTYASSVLRSYRSAGDPVPASTVVVHIPPAGFLASTAVDRAYLQAADGSMFELQIVPATSLVSGTAYRAVVPSGAYTAFVVEHAASTALSGPTPGAPRTYSVPVTLAPGATVTVERASMQPVTVPVVAHTTPGVVTPPPRPAPSVTTPPDVIVAEQHPTAAAPPAGHPLRTAGLVILAGGVLVLGYRWSKS